MASKGIGRWGQGQWESDFVLRGVKYVTFYECFGKVPLPIRAFDQEPSTEAVGRSNGIALYDLHGIIMSS